MRLLLLSVLFIYNSALAQPRLAPTRSFTTDTTEQKIRSLIGQMTLPEKVSLIHEGDTLKIECLPGGGCII